MQRLEEMMIRELPSTLKERLRICSSLELQRKAPEWRGD
jgi:hypothetical protein